MEVIKITPRGSCYGVVDAIETARRAAKDPNLPRPIYILGFIVHNQFVVEELSRLGIVTLDGSNRFSLLAQVEHGTVIFTAHGVSPAVKQLACERRLYVIDTTCPEVAHTHELVRRLAAQGYQIIYIGKKGHPEPEGLIGEAAEAVHLVETEDDLNALPERVWTAQRVAVTTQTTLSQWDTASLVRLIRMRLPHAEIYNEICHATQVRQEAVARMAREADLTIVVGDRRSDNTTRLVQVAQQIAGCPAVRIDSVYDLTPELFVGKRRVAITSGASTPSQITREVIRFVEGLGIDTSVK
jgi:4-hydroxy-3-methylbut-2-enyl diphosphate reductase